MEHDEGEIAVEDGYHVWYRRIGNGGIPLLTLHGGPGAGHDYLESLEGLASDRAVIFYDQLGCGMSDRPDDPSRWVIDRFVSEIDTVRLAHGLEEIHLLGQSWGGWLAIEYMLTQPPGVVSLTLASSSASVPQFVAETERLKSQLPSDVYETLRHYEASGDYHNPEYEEATGEFYQRHLCQLADWPETLLRTISNLTDNHVYETMNGPNEFTVIGNMKDWDRTDRLHEIEAPTLITVGRFDELTPACSKTLLNGIPNSKMVIFEESAHLAHLEEPVRYLQVVAEFLEEAESRRGQISL